ncbi:MAG: ThuA domain-containing protein [Planctomycetes bacterium]|nr:ThuA domain-containing protein [Planctomycetota bacterium]
MRRNRTRRQPRAFGTRIGFVAAVLALAGAATALRAQAPEEAALARAVERIAAAAPAAAPARPCAPRRLLVFTRTCGYRHAAIPVGTRALEILGKKTGAFETVVSNDLERFRPENLACFDAVCFLNTTGPVFASAEGLEARRSIQEAENKYRELEALLDLAGKDVAGKELEGLRRHLGAERPAGRLTAGELLQLREAADAEQVRIEAARGAIAEARRHGEEGQLERNLLAFVRGGGGFVGIHAATDTLHESPDYLAMVGGVFAGHPWNANTTVAVKLDDPAHPINAAFGEEGFRIRDEIYQLKGPYTRERLRVLLSLDVGEDGKEKISGIAGSREDRDHAISWVQRYGRGRVFYCSLGHNDGVFWNPAVLGHYLAGIQFALGDLEADARPSAEGAAPPADRLVSAAEGYAVDPFMGIYPGWFTPEQGAARPAEAFVIADGGGKYRVALGAPAGAPTFRIELAAAVASTFVDALAITGTDDGAEWQGCVAAGRMALRAESANGGTFEGRLCERQSPTLGAPPPAGAVVLLPFDGSPPALEGWTNASWKALADGSMAVGQGSNVTRRAFGDVKVHLEFCIPYEPGARGQGRGNSGVYLMDRYEVQLLDSFGLVPQADDCGAVYGVAGPRVNACLPPLRWQTYDIEFRAARFGGDPETVVELPRITVRHNGQLIHDNAEVPRTTPGGSGSKLGHGREGPLMLQDHKNPLRFRNLWAVERKEER